MITADITFKQQAHRFLTAAQTRRNSPIKGATVRAYQSHINKLLPLLANVPLSGIRNGIARELVEKLTADGLKPASINAIFHVMKQIVASAVNEEGDQLFPVIWNHDFIDLPPVNPEDQDAPTITPQSITETISRTNTQQTVLYALLAGTGLRVGEALALLCGPDLHSSFWSLEQSKIFVRGTLSGGVIQNSTKTSAGEREVDLPRCLNLFLQNRLSIVPGSLLFPSETGGLARINTVYQRLAADGIKAGFHCFRRFRITHLRKNGCPEELIKYWVGHAKKGITDRYDKTAQDVNFRREWTEKVGLGFDL